MLGGGLNGVLAEPPTARPHEVEHLGIRALEHHVERRLRSDRAALSRRTIVPIEPKHRADAPPVAWVRYGRDA